jgi:hypothetical protein
MLHRYIPSLYHRFCVLTQAVTASLRRQLSAASTALVELAASAQSADIQKEALWAIANLVSEGMFPFVFDSLTRKRG